MDLLRLVDADDDDADDDDDEEVAPSSLSYIAHSKLSSMAELLFFCKESMPWHRSSPAPLPPGL